MLTVCYRLRIQWEPITCTVPMLFCKISDTGVELNKRTHQVYNVEPSVESDRISKQQIARRDLLLPGQPKVERLNTVWVRLLMIHMCFCGTVLVLGSAFPAAARLLAVAVSPISKIVFRLYPTYRSQFAGQLGKGFYEAVIGETFFVAFATLFMYQTIYIARYWRCPWRFNEFYMEQLGVRRSVVSAIVTAAIAGPIAILLGAVLYHWFGFSESEPVAHIVEPYQLALWSFMTPNAALIFVLAVSMAVSSTAAAIRRLFRCVVESGHC